MGFVNEQAGGVVAGLNQLADLAGVPWGQTTKSQAGFRQMMNLIMNPQFGALTGTYINGAGGGGYLPDPQVGMPTAYDYLNAQGPMGAIVQQLMSNDPSVHITPDGAQRLLMNEINDSTSPLSGQDATFLTGQLNKVIGEINDYSALKAKHDAAVAASDPFVKAGLPSESQRWDANSVPYMRNAITQKAFDFGDYQLQQAAHLYGMEQQPDGSWKYTRKRPTPVQAPPTKLSEANPTNVTNNIPRSEDDVRKWAKAAGVDAGPAIEWYRGIVENLPNTKVQGGVYDSERTVTRSPKDDARFQKQWKEVLYNHLHMQNTDMGLGTKDAAKAIVNYVPPPVNNGPTHDEQMFNAYLRQNAALSADELGRRMATADHMNSTGQTPLEVGKQQRIAMARQLFGL